jgi:hypothetical protein
MDCSERVAHQPILQPEGTMSNGNRSSQGARLEAMPEVLKDWLLR